MVTSLIALTLAVIFNELRLKTQGLGSVPASMAVKLINQGATVLDIREQEKFAKGHIVDSRNIGESELRDSELEKLKKKKAVLLVCDNGLKSAKCAADLRKGGFESVFSLKGGIMSWQQENLPVTAD